MSEKVNKFLTTVGAVWGKRHDSEESGREWFKSWIYALEQFDPWIIEAAARRIIDERTDDYFPKPAEVRKVCFQIRADDQRGRPELTVAQPQRDPFAFADHLIRCELGKRAAREGWALTLRDFVAKENRLPEGDREIAKIIATRDKFLRDLQNCINGRGGLIGGDLTVLGLSMVRRELAIAKRLLGENAPDWYAGKLGREAA